MTSAWKIMSTGGILLMGVACAPVAPKPHNPFQITQGQFHNQIKTIALAPLQLPQGLQNPASVKAQFELILEGKLTTAGFSVVRSQIYGEVWNRKLGEMGGHFDPRTGDVIESKYKDITQQTKMEIHSHHKADAFLYWAVRVFDPWVNGPIVRWDGTSEDAWVKGKRPGDDQYKVGKIRALSLVVSIEDKEGGGLYANAGGIQLLAKIYKWGHFDMDLFCIPEEEILTQRGRNAAAVEIALGPLIKTSATTAPVR